MTLLCPRIAPLSVSVNCKCSPSLTSFRVGRNYLIELCSDFGQLCCTYFQLWVWRRMGRGSRYINSSLRCLVPNQRLSIVLQYWLQSPDTEAELVLVPNISPLHSIANSILETLYFECAQSCSNHYRLYSPLFRDLDIMHHPVHLYEVNDRSSSSCLLFTPSYYQFRSQNSLKEFFFNCAEVLLLFSSV